MNLTTTTRAILVGCGLLLGLAPSAYSNVTVTAASGGSALSADTAGIGGSGAWTTLGSTRIDEGAKGDFGQGNGATLVLKAPAGFEFNTASTPSISFAGGADITGASIAVSDSTTLTVTLNVSGTGSRNDVVTIGNSGLQVRPVQAAPLAVARHIYRPATGGGTASIVGITTSSDGSTGSNFGSLAEVPGAFLKLQLLMPGEAASPGAPSGKTGTPNAQTAGIAFNVIVNGVDANWNVVPSANGTGFSMHLASSDVNAVLPADANLATGTRTFSVSLRTAGTATVTASDASDGTKTPSASPLTTVNIGAFSKLQVLAPGENAAPGTASGKSGSPSAQTAGNPFSVVVNAVDATWNLINTNDTVAISSGDPNAVLPSPGPLAGGTGVFSVTLKTSGSRTVSASDSTHPGITANTSSAIFIGAGAFSRLQLLLPGESAAPGTINGKSGTASAEVAGAAFAIIVNAVDTNWNVATSITDTIGFTSSDGSATLPGNTALISGTGSFNVTFRASASSQSITATDISDGTKTPSTSAAAVNPGPASKLDLAVQPSASATAGMPFTQQPVVLIEDAFNNIRSNDTLVVTATRNSGFGDILGTTSIAAVGGVATFANLAAAGATNVTLQFSSGALTPAISSNIAVAAGAFSRLLLVLPGETYAPGTPTGRSGTPVAAAGAIATARVSATDAYFNLINSISHTVQLTTTDPNASNPANTALVNGTNSLNVTLRTAGNQTVTVSDVTDGTKTNSSDSVVVSPGPFARLQLLVPGELAAAGTTAGKTGVPSAQNALTAFPVTVNGVDTNWNVVPSANGAGFTIHLASSDANAILPADADLASGTRISSVTLRTAGTATLTASDIDDGTKTPNTSPSITINAGPFTQLQVLLPGETAAPGSSTGKTGSATAQTAGVAFNATVNAVDAAWNLRLTNDTVHVTSSDPNAVLPADAALANGTRTFSITHRTSGATIVTAADISRPGIGTNNSSSVTVNPASYAKFQVLMPGETAAPGTTLGKTGAPSARTAGTSFNILAVGTVDSFWNAVPTNVTVHITSSDLNATLPADSGLGAGGVKTNFALTFKTAGTQTITATDVNDATRTNTSSLTTVIPGAFNKLQVLVPGETAAPGSASGKLGSPLNQTSSIPFSVTVNGVDANWNLINTNDTVHLTSSDPSALLPANAALVSGTRALAVTLQTAGMNATVSASDVTHAGILASTSSPFSVVTPPAPRVTAMVAIHDSELTRALENITASPPTPSGTGSTGKEWWPTNWHYFVMPESLKEALRSEGIPFDVISDADIANGRLLTTNGRPAYPIVFSLASESVADNELAPLTNYVAAGGFLFAGSSAFTRTTTGTTRGDFAIGNAMGIHMVIPGLTNWTGNSTFTKQLEHRLTEHIPSGVLNWEMPVSGEENPWGTYPHSGNPFPISLLWQVQPAGATVVASGNNFPYLLDRPFGKGRFIYHAAMQPLIAHGGWGPGMYAYQIFKKSIEWAFENARLPLPRLSPWPYQYDAALIVRHDLEDYQTEIAGLEASAQVEFTNGVKGDYFFCTGTLREEMAPAGYNTNNVVTSLRRAISNYSATIGPHNGGLRNPYNVPPLTTNNYDYWHWGPDEALDVTPAGYPNGKAYAMASVSNSFLDIERWLPGQMTNGMRVWVAPYFDATRENSYDIQAQLGVKIAGEQKLSPFPHWTLSTQTSGKRYAFLSIPVSDWYVDNTVAQAMEAGHTSASIHAGVDYYYNLGGLVNFYSHTLSTGLGAAGGLVLDYITYSMNTNLHPRLWAANSIGVYNWWLRRSNALMSVTYFATNGDQVVLRYDLSGATDTNTAVEAAIPGPGTYSNLQVFTNGTAAGANVFRTNGQVIKIRTGASVTNAELRYLLNPIAQPDYYTFQSGPVLSIAAPGVLTNDLGGPGATGLSALLVSGPTNGTLSLSNNGGFTFMPGASFAGLDAFTYKLSDGSATSGPTVVTLVDSSSLGFTDDFSRGSDPGPIAPWVNRAGNWAVTAGELRGGTNTLQTYANVFLTNTWSDYSVQARLRFPVGSFGGGLGGRLEPASGAHYAAWFYPENSPAGSNVLRLIKFQNWTTWTQMQQVNLAAVGTNFHTVKLAIFGPQILVYFDGVPMINVADSSPTPYLSGGVSIDTWTDTIGYVAAADDVRVTGLVAGESYTVNQNQTLNVSAPGVLGNDTSAFGQTLTSVLVLNPGNGLLNLNPNGGFTYTPNANFSGTDQFIYQANDGQTNIGTARVTIVVNPVASTNPPPVITKVALSNGVVTLSWTSVAGRSYRAQFSTNITSINWSNVVPDVVASGATASATNSVGSAARRFYRVLLLP